MSRENILRALDPLYFFLRLSGTLAFKVDSNERHLTESKMYRNVWYISATVFIALYYCQLLFGLKTEQTEFTLVLSLIFFAGSVSKLLLVKYVLIFKEKDVKEFWERSFDIYEKISSDSIGPSKILKYFLLVVILVKSLIKMTFLSIVSWELLDTGVVISFTYWLPSMGLEVQMLASKVNYMFTTMMINYFFLKMNTMMKVLDVETKKLKTIRKIENVTSLHESVSEIFKIFNRIVSLQVLTAIGESFWLLAVYTYNLISKFYNSSYTNIWYLGIGYSVYMAVDAATTLVMILCPAKVSSRNVSRLVIILYGHNIYKS